MRRRRAAERQVRAARSTSSGLGRLIVTASAANHRYVRELGATRAIDYRTEDVVRRVLDLTDGEGSISLWTRSAPGTT